MLKYIRVADSQLGQHTGLRYHKPNGRVRKIRVDFTLIINFLLSPYFWL